MVKDFADMSPVEVEMRVTEVNEGDACDEEHQPGVVALTSRVERIVTELITVREIVDVALFFPSGGASI